MLSRMSFLPLSGGNFANALISAQEIDASAVSLAIPGPLDELIILVAVFLLPLSCSGVSDHSKRGRRNNQLYKNLNISLEKEYYDNLKNEAKSLKKVMKQKSF